MTRSLIRSAIGLALTSAILSVIMFRMHSGFAAVFELSVCSGLISVLFVCAISLTHSLHWDEIIKRMKDRIARFWYLPFIVVGAGLSLLLLKIKLKVSLPAAERIADARLVLWNSRHIDLCGQIIILLAGVFGVVILFKERLK
jgi:NADH-quinone oxidoreductase subunit J